MDYDLFVRFMKIGHFRRLDRVLAAFRVHSRSKTSSQIETLGMLEIQAVWQKNGITGNLSDSVIANWFSQVPSEFGRLHAHTHRHLAGAFPDIGYDYDLVWGGFFEIRSKGDTLTGQLDIDNLAALFFNSFTSRCSFRSRHESRARQSCF